ncbi:acyltransferase, partial [Acinetobacter baumannii]
MKKFLGNSIFKAVGWTYDADPTILEKKQVIIGFEHTSNLDAILSIALFQIL